MSEETFFERPVPKAALLGAAALVGFALFAAFGARITDIGTTELEQAEAVIERELHFEDRLDGSVAVVEAATEDLVHLVEPGTGGFVRGVLRGMSRERKLRGIGPDAPYRLTGWSNGGLSLTDPQTGVRIDLEPFGPTNSALFAHILTAESEPQVNSQVSL